MFAAFLNAVYPVSEEATEAFWLALEKKKFRKGDRITMEQQIQKELYFVFQGIQMSSFNNDGKLHIMAFTYPPSFSGIPDSFLLQKPSSYQLEALTDSELGAVSFLQRQELMNQFPDIERFFRIMTEQILAGFMQRYLELHALTIEQRFRSFVKRSPHLLHKIPRKYIANYLHIDPTNFSKLFNSIRIE